MWRATQSEDTIYAVSSGLGKSAVAVIRVSGPQCASILKSLCPGAAFTDRRATLARIVDESGDLLDRGLVISFAAPRSFTGEDMIEFQVTGSRAVVSGLLSALASLPGTTPAEAGEFAFRAFVGGKLDLVEVEGLASVVEAETRAQLRQAALMASGATSRELERVRSMLLRAIATTESLLDFSDVEDATELSVGEAVFIAIAAKTHLIEMLDNKVSERLRDGLIVVIAGAPNAGKSTLLNHLAKRDVAIVSATPGTTRDTLEVAAEVAGYPVTFIDTAGIRETTDLVETLGVARAIQKGANADLILWLYETEDASTPAAEFAAKHVFGVRTKLDVAGEQVASGLAISARTGRGVETLISRIADFAAEHFSGVGRVLMGTERQRSAARDAIAALGRVEHEAQKPVEFIAEDLRLAATAVGRIVGRVEVEEVLGEIFSRLCVGK